MATVHKNNLLNDLLIDVSRSLLQYAVEAWPWTANDAEFGLKTVRELAASQRARVAELAELLTSRGHIIDFGIYPTEYTDLHYVALSYFLKLLETSQQELIAEVDRVLAGCRDDHAAVDVLDDLLQTQRDIAKSLSELRQHAPNAA